jgi:peroxiredoxin Q/BCP
LRDAFAELNLEGLQVIGASLDKPAAQKAFQQKHRLPFPLAADVDGAMAKAFGVPTMMGFARRQSFLIKDGKIAWVDLNASTRQQAEDVRKALHAAAVA